MHLVGLTIEIYYDARPSERQSYIVCYSYLGKRDRKSVPASVSAVLSYKTCTLRDRDMRSKF